MYTRCIHSYDCTCDLLFKLLYASLCVVCLSVCMSACARVRAFVYAWPLPADLVTQYFTMDNDQSNPYFAWVAAGSPQYPSKDLLKRMRSQQEPVSRVYETYNSASFGHAKRIDMTFRLNMPAVSLVHVCQLASVPPPQVCLL